MISFAPTDDQKLMIDASQKLAKTLAARIRETEKSGLSVDLRDAAIEMGVGVVHLPEAVGGAGLGLVTAVLLEEEIAAGDPAAAFALGGTSGFGLAMAELGSEEQSRDAVATPGAVAFGEPRPHRERAGLSTLAKKDGDGKTFSLKGEKAYVLGADRAERFVVFAQVDEAKGVDGIGAFLVEKGTGVKVVTRSRTLGLDAASFGGLELDGARGVQLLGGDDFSAATIRFFARHALLVAARCVGLSRAAFDVTRAYVEQRRAFGKPVAHFQAVAFTVADRAMDVEASRALVHRAAWLWDQNEDPNAALLATARAVSYAQGAAMRGGDDGVQLHGGAGFMRDYAVEKYMRDAKQIALCGMPAACADQLAAAIELGRKPDLALVLPWPDSQSAFI